MVHHEPDSEGYSPPGEIPEETAELAAEDLPSGEVSVAGAPFAGDLPSGEMPVKEEAAEVLEHLPPGKKSKTEAAEEDVEMDAPEQEEPPQDEPMPTVVDMPDYNADDDEDSIPEEEMMERATALINSTVYEHFAHEEHPEEARSSSHFTPTRAMAKFLHRMVGKEPMEENCWK